MSPTALLFLFLFLHLTSMALSQQLATSYRTIAYSFPPLKGPNKPSFTTSYHDQTIKGPLQLTPKYANGNFTPAQKSGRILLNHPFSVWDLEHTSMVASYSTIFTTNLLSLDDYKPGVGLSFLIVPNTNEPPPGSDGYYLGLTNSVLDGRSSDNLIAVVFNTYSNLIGLDINSIVSNTTTNLTILGIQIAPQPSAEWAVWIDYDGRRYINVSESPKPAAPVLNATLDLSEHLVQWSCFGFAASAGNSYQLNETRSWNLTVEYIPPQSHWPAWKYTLAITLPLVAVTIMLGIIVSNYLTRRRTKDGASLTEILKRLPGMPREFTFKELKLATNNFDESLKLGQGGFGVVYKGVMQEENFEVAVKKFSREGISSQDDFLKELNIIIRLRHKHLVPLIGWCHKNGMLLLVYELMTNGSLDQHLFGGMERPILSWEQRYNIISGLASALHYLHVEYDHLVVHRDLKPSNVMLDGNFNARLGDFGLARALDANKTSYTELELGGMPGTLGYIAPECFHTGKATRQSDVFSFGTVVLEVASGRRPLGENGYLSDMVWKLYREGRIFEAVDPRMAGNYVAPEAEKLFQLALSCCHPISRERPSMQVVVQFLAGVVVLPPVPQFKPAFMWPVIDEGEGSTATTMSSLVTNHQSVEGISIV